MFKKSKTLLFIALFLIVSGSSVLALAQTPPPAAPPATPDTTEVKSLPNPLGEGNTDLSLIIGRIIRGILSMLGVLALVMFIYGGILWMTSGGSEDKIRKGKDTIVWSILGLAIIFASYSILNFVFSVIFKVNTPTP